MKETSKQVRRWMWSSPKKQNAKEGDIKERVEQEVPVEVFLGEKLENFKTLPWIPRAGCDVK